mmetsp:Transcript_39/g.68  ORF Transcript_39/g.68 Transcript_39/m.68 type:complete len:118 (-) Transcript_39:137-490(-)|eukprot:CAMPEP_0175040866 /NCGR_PEP_ID=MMETSP0052_2-20121109/1539_1 /TAXON_ID=51329 ORGANISM="Polytomella parva, Strain SAG 63-3" /NCGR_SAMPLE_ID=MMETSP0052_2 /ASSEMBLY_ACC=CAM_ASM_000194 /LENGTH=117 /DNA_ID=CAMNT_0016303201 /DNA_START=86 /DNA_END=439 /DNA_ORIENTATION=+
MSNKAGARGILTLYRHILKLHREKLPAPVRNLGDSYLKAEFRSHLRGKTSMEQWTKFVKEWKGYYGMLRGDGEPDADLALSTLSNEGLDELLSKDQQKRMTQLKEEINNFKNNGAKE